MHRKRTYAAFSALIIAALACNIPGSNTPQASGFDVVSTAAAQTVAARLTGVVLTQAAAGAIPTDTPAPSSSDTPAPGASDTASPATATTQPAAPTSTPVCDQMSFIADVTIPDGTNEDPNAAFTKTWRIKNTGVCAWTSSYALVFVSGDSMSGPTAVPLAGSVSPGDTVDVSAGLQAPATSGDSVGTWKLRNAGGVLFGLMTVQIHVNGPGPFAVIHVTFSTSFWNDAGHVNCPKITAQITTNAAGTVQYNWTDDGGGSHTIQTITFSAAGTKNVSEEWSLGSAWAGHDNWAGIYIDIPNHQDFGHTSVTACTSP